MNKVFLVGKAGAPGELRRLGKGGQVMNFTVQTQKLHNGKVYTTYHRCVAWGGVAEHAFREGDTVFVEGELRRNKVTKDGVETWQTDINVRDIQVIASDSGTAFTQVEDQIPF